MVAISDSRGGVFNSRGIDPLKAMRYKERSGTVVGMPGASRISNEELLALKCDILWGLLDAVHYAYVSPGYLPPLWHDSRKL